MWWMLKNPKVSFICFCKAPFSTKIGFYLFINFCCERKFSILYFSIFSFYKSIFFSLREFDFFSLKIPTFSVLSLFYFKSLEMDNICYVLTSPRVTFYWVCNPYSWLCLTLSVTLSNCCPIFCSFCIKLRTKDISSTSLSV